MMAIFALLRENFMRIIANLAIAWAIIFSASVQATGDILHQYQLKNGLTVLVKEDHRAPVVVSQVWYKVGGSYEPNGLTGISHALEHMMFKGTAKYPNGKFSEIIAENGGQENAFTSSDYTGYYQILAADKLPLSFKLEADRMRHLNIKDSDFASEIEVIKEERKLRIDNSPQAKTFERFAAAAYLANPYHQPVIGWPADLESMTASDLRQWYHAWYGPNNATVVVVGDVKADDVFKLAKRYYGSLKPVRLPEVKPHQTATPLGTRTVEVNVPAKLPMLIMGYNTPNYLSEPDKKETYALDVLAYILGGADSAILEKKLVRGKQIATTANTGYDLYSRLPGLFIISAVPAQGHSINEVKSAIMDEINLLKTHLVSPQALERLKAQVIAAKIFAKDSLSAQANLIGSTASVGIPWEEIDQYPQRVQQVTAEDIMKVVKKYITPDRLTIGILKPQPIANTVQQSGDHHE